MTGRPSVAIGCAIDGTRPNRAEVAWAEVRLDAPAWGGHPASALRGAIAAHLDHVDFHGHAPDGLRQTRATVLYRVDPLRVWCYGPRALDNAAAIAGLTHLRLPSGDGCPIEGATVRSGVEDCGATPKNWHRYELATPYFPAGATQQRRPTGPDLGPEHRAWAGHALASSIRAWLADNGVEPDANRPVHVQVEECRTVPAPWREGPPARAFLGRWVSNALVPDGAGLGQHVSEGWGEVRRA